MTVLSFTAKQWPDDVAQRMGDREYIVATIDLTNSGSRPISYLALGSETFDGKTFGFVERKTFGFAQYTVLHETPTGWKEPPRGFRCGTGIEQCVLAPSEAITFQAIVDRDKPCKVALNYSDGRTPSRLWQRLPSWLTQRLPWGKGRETVTTDVIDLRGATGLTAKPEESFFKEPEKTPVIQAAAQSGDTDAQFRLAGRFWTGSCLEKSPADAMRWYEAAATNGHADAAYSLGSIYEHGLVTHPNLAEAVYWYRKASERGHAEAKDRLKIVAAK